MLIHPVIRERIPVWVGMILLASSALSLAVGQTTPASTTPPLSPPPPPVPWVVQIVEVEGTVEFSPPSRPQNWHLCHTNDFLFPKYQIRTGPRARAILRLRDGSSVPIGPDSLLEIFPPEQERTWINLLRGFLYLFRRGPPEEYHIGAPSVSTVTRGTEFSMQVTEDGTTLLQLFEGEILLTNQLGTVALQAGQAATVKPGQAPLRSPFLETAQALQWRLYYPAVLALRDLPRPLDAEPDLQSSLEAYRQGDLQLALQRYPVQRQPRDDSETLYLASLWLVVGQVEKSETLLSSLVAPHPAATNQTTRAALRLALALQSLIAVVRQTPPPPRPTTPSSPCVLATEWLVASYEAQSQNELDFACQTARNAINAAPEFGFAWVRLAELEFGFGRNRAAMKAIDRGLQFIPRNAQALAIKGFLLAGQNRSTEALSLFEQAISLDGALGNAWLGRGLVQIKQGRLTEGLSDLQTAAALEPQRSLLRSYLGKGFHEIWDIPHAQAELDRARQLDPLDPTPWLYAALLQRDQNRLNQAVRDLEQSQDLNNQRQLYRSRLLLDQDQAVRGANLAAIYQEAGLADVSLRESVRAVNTDYANYSAHLFLANSYQQLRDPRQIDLRYETAWFTEYLVGHLLAPVGARGLSPLVSQQEYSRLFDRNRLGLQSLTEYTSNGDWLQAGSQYGVYERSEYAFDATYRSRHGQRPNNDMEDLTLTLRAKQELSPQDTLYIQALTYDSEAGDLAARYDPADARTGWRVEENQEPIVLAGYHHAWAPGSHTLFLAGWLDDELRVRHDAQTIYALEWNPLNPQNGLFREGVGVTQLDYLNDFNAYTLEAQQLWQSDQQTLTFGSRFQSGDFDTTSELAATSFVLDNVTAANPVVNNFSNSIQSASTDLERFSAYGYWTWNLFESVQLTAGVSYDYLRYPENHRAPPVSKGEETIDQVSPKAGLIWTPWQNSALRAAYTRSLGGVSFDQSFRLEPTQVGGFNQAFRSVVPESVTGSLTAPEFETWGVAWDQKFETGTYLGVQAERIGSASAQEFGVFESTANGFNRLNLPSVSRQKLDFEEKTLLLTFNQLIGDHWSAGARYRLSSADLKTSYPQLETQSNIATRSDVQSILHQIQWFLLAFHPSGIFGQADSIWSQQSNRGYTPDRPGDDFWQFNLHLGYRFPRRRAELRASLLNFTDQDYRLNPLNLTPELPRDRTLALSLRLAF